MWKFSWEIRVRWAHPFHYILVKWCWKIGPCYCISGTASPVWTSVYYVDDLAAIHTCIVQTYLPGLKKSKKDSSLLSRLELQMSSLDTWSPRLDTGWWLPFCFRSEPTPNQTGYLRLQLQSWVKPQTVRTSWLESRVLYNTKTRVESLSSSPDQTSGFIIYLPAATEDERIMKYVLKIMKYWYHVECACNTVQLTIASLIFYVEKMLHKWY